MTDLCDEAFSRLDRLVGWSEGESCENLTWRQARPSGRRRQSSASGLHRRSIGTRSQKKWVRAYKRTQDTSFYLAVTDALTADEVARGRNHRKLYRRISQQQISGRSSFVGHIPTLHARPKVYQVASSKVLGTGDVRQLAVEEKGHGTSRQFLGIFAHC